MPKLTIIDGNSLLFRAYYATAIPGMEIMRNKDGTPTNAIFAFSNMINKIISGIKEGEAIFVAFDAGKHNFRHDQLETYKANRKPAPEDLVIQFPIVREFLHAMRIYQFEEVGFEGDDIAGTMAKKAAQLGYEVTVYTSDRDFLQLADDKITINTIRKGLSDVIPMTPELIKETYGIEPLQIIDYKGLRGDTSDNLPGIPGVGEKTAVKLINDYGSFDNIIAHAEEIPGKLGESIRENKEIGTISRDLAIIKTDIDLPFTVQDTTYKGYYFSSINEFCQKYGLKQFMNKISSKWKLSDETGFNLEIEEISSFKGIDVGDKIGIELDYENRDDYFRSDFFGIGIYANNHCYYIKSDDAKKDETFLNILKNKNVGKYAFDYKAIKVCLSKHNIMIDGLAFDLLIASYLIDTTIKATPEVALYIYGIDIDGGTQNELSLFSDQNPEKTAKIAYYSYFLENKAKDNLQKVTALDLYNNLELPLVDTLANMEIEGFPLDVKILDELGNEYKKKLEVLTSEIHELAGEKFVISSPKQTAEILFTKLNLPGNKKGSTSSENLKELISCHPIVNKILEYRKYFKLVTTYTEGLKPHVYQDGKIHASFNQALTQTGRLSSSNPNLQNISIRDEEGKMLRKAFYYPDENIEILSFDYSQIELRILAHLSKCGLLLDNFKNGIDAHTATAKAVFNVEEPTPLQRRRAKVVNFGIVYGMSDWGLADELEISVKEAKEIINNFYTKFPEIASFFKEVVSNALNDGYVSTILGRRRYLRELHDTNYQAREFAKRAAMNAPIQGSAADLIKLAMINVEKEIEKRNLQSKMVLQIHDELIFKVPKEEKEIMSELVKNTMEHAMELSLPLEVDGGFGRTWYDAK